MGKALRFLRKGAELVREKRWREAVEVYLQGTEDDPTDPRCWLGLGVCLSRVGNWGMSRIALERAQKMGHPRAERALSWVEQAQRRAAEKERISRGAAPVKAAGPTAERLAAEKAHPPPRPARLPVEERLDLGREVPVMLVEPIEADRQAITEAIEGNIKRAKVDSVPFSISSLDTLSGTVFHDVAVLDWDADPDAAAGLAQILKIKRPKMQIVCLVEKWEPAKCVEILETGADYHLVKEPHFASVIPLVIAQLERRDSAVLQQYERQHVRERPGRWPECLNAVGEPIVLVDSHYSIVGANEAAKKAFGKEESELVGQPYPTVLHGAEEPPESCPLLQALRRKKPAEGRIYQADSQMTFQAQAWPVSSEAGEAQAAIAFLREEAAPVAGEEGAPSEADNLLALLDEGVDRLQCGIVVLDADDRITWLNSQATDLLCAEKGSLLRRDYVDALSQALGELMESPGSFIETVVDAHLTGQDLEGHELRLFGAPQGRMLKYWSTRVRGGPPSVRRVEHYYPAEEVRVVSPAAQTGGIPADRIVEAIEDLLFTTDNGGNIVWSSPAAAAVTGYSQASLRGTPLVALTSPDDREKVQSLLQRTVAAGTRALKEDVALVRADGKRCWAELTLLPLVEKQSGKTQGAQGVLRDITERRITEAIRDLLAGSLPPRT